MADEIKWDDDVVWDSAPVGIDSRRSASPSIGPTRRQIPSRDDLGQTVRAMGAYLPGSDYVAGAGGYLQDRLPLALGGTAPGQERTWQETLDDTRANREEAAGAEPAAALAGAVLGTKNLPWSKGSGPISLLKRAAEAAGLTFATEVSQGKDVLKSMEEGGKTGLVAGTIEAATKLPGAIRALGGFADKKATRAAWLSGDPSKKQARDVAEALDPLKVSGEVPAGEFMKNAKLADGTFVVGGSQEDTARRMKQFIEEWGTRKGALVDAAEAKGAQVDVGAIMSEARALSAELDSPAMRVTNPDAKAGFDKVLNRLEAEYGIKNPEVIGYSRRGVGAQVVEMTPAEREAFQEGRIIAPDPVHSQPVDAPKQVTKAPRSEDGKFLPHVHKGDNLPPARPVPIKRNPESAGNVTPQGLQPGMEVPRLIPGTLRPNPYSGYTPTFKEQPPPQQIGSWEELKTGLQKLVEDTKSGLNRADNAIDASPVLQKLRGLASKVKSADEAAIAKVATPEEYAAFMKAKTNFGTAKELEPLYLGASDAASSATGVSSTQDARRFGRSLPWLLGGTAGMAPGAASGNVGLALAGALTGAGVAKLADTAAHAHPTMTRVYDAVGRNLRGVKGPPVDLDPQTAALVAYLRSQQQETP